MNETAYWSRLEYRVCQEMHGLDVLDLRRFWCDGFIPERYELADPPPRIIGRVWMGVGPREQEQWEFTLLLGRQVESREGVEWSALLPSPDLTKWLSLDPARKRLVMEPTAAVADAS